MVLKIEHIGVAVKDIENSVKPYVKLLGLNVEAIEEIAVVGVVNKVAFLPLRETEIELLETTAKTGLIAEHLREHGEGIHHIAFEVNDVEKMYKTLKAQGAAILWDRVIPGSRGTKCMFFASEEFNGVYIELVEKPK